MSMMTRGVCAIACILAMASGIPQKTGGVSETVERIIARMHASLTKEQMLAMDEATAERFVTPEDRAILATAYWVFDVNVPVRVSVMRHTGQSTVPFWLAENGFRRTNLRVTNEEYEYEVWQKDFSAGRVGLGINGFEKHRVHYFVCIGPKDAAARLQVKPVYPANQQVAVMRKGASIYHDWPDLVLTEVPTELEGQLLLPTIRGRAREAHIVRGFRRSPYPSSTSPDQIVLTFAGDPQTSMAVQWRTSSSVERGVVEWRRVGETTWRRTAARSVVLRDSRILNDPTVRHHEAKLEGLTPGTRWDYRVGTPTGPWSDVAVFTTAPRQGGAFSFLWLSDTHNQPATAELLRTAERTFPDSAFCAITGDLVGTGQYRDDWDQFFAHVGTYAKSHPLVPTIGNHDTIDGLGADLYLRLFTLPQNGASALQPERSYSFMFGNALFIVLDCTDSVEAQTPWLERTLRRSEAAWKFALFHFPPYALSRDYPEIEREWVPLFDRYHVDFVLCGHVHHLQRTKPLRGGRVVSSPADGTIYLTTVAVGQGRTVDRIPDDSVVAMEPGPPLFHAFRIEERRAHVECRDASGKIWDELTVTK